MKIEGSKLATLAAVALVLIAGAFAFGTSFGQRTMLARATLELNGVQAMLAFNRIQDERHLQSLLLHGCTDQAVDFVDYTKDKDMELLSGFLRGQIDAEARKYVTDRDANLVEELRTFKSKYGTSWMEKTCKAS
jgi:hypothetical protein